MTNPAAIDFGNHQRAKSKRQRSTSPSFWWALAIVVVTLDALRLPKLLDGLQADVPPALIESAGDPAIVNTALKIGAYASLALVPIIIGLCALAGNFLESRFFPHQKEFGRWRLGLAFCATTVALVTDRLVSLFSLDGAARFGTLGLVVVVFASGGAWLFSPSPVDARVWLRGAILALGIGVVICTL